MKKRKKYGNDAFIKSINGLIFDHKKAKKIDMIHNFIAKMETPFSAEKTNSHGRKTIINNSIKVFGNVFVGDIVKLSKSGPKNNTIINTSDDFMKLAMDVCGFDTKNELVRYSIMQTLMLFVININFSNDIEDVINEYNKNVSNGDL